MRFQQPLVDFGLRWAGAHARAAARCIPGPDEYTVHTGKDFERKEHVWKLIIRDEGNYLVTILFKPERTLGWALSHFIFDRAQFEQVRLHHFGDERGRRKK
jgi:hypothetical protein